MGSRRKRIENELHGYLFNERTIDVVRAYLDAKKRGHVEPHVGEAAADILSPFVEYAVEERKKGKAKAWKEGYDAGWKARKQPSDLGTEETEHPHE